MTFNRFKKDFIMFLEESTVNLGRRTAETRKLFIEQAKARFDAFADSQKKRDVEQIPEVVSPNNRLICLKPTDRTKVLDAGKGVTAMTPSESARADEQLGRSPFTGKGEKNE